jgi:hypothetical protein
MKQGGVLLLDIGKGSQQKLCLIFVIIFLVIYLEEWIVVLKAYSEERMEEAVSVLFSLYLLLIISLLGFIHNKIRDRGIYYWGHFIKWKRIKSYAWEGENGFTLTLILKQPLPIFHTLSIPIPATHKDTVESLLKQNLPVKISTQT